MRLIAVCAPALALVLAGTACAPPPDPAPAPAAPVAADLPVNPARIDRARDHLPDDYEVTAYTGAPSPFAVWGLRDTPATDPAPCAVLGAPAVDPATARGWSASGPGGIVYAVVAGATEPAAPSPGPDQECREWTVASGHTTGVVTGVAGPDIEAARTTGMSAVTTTVVEGGTETHAHADTFVADLGGYVCFVAVLTDPGSPHPALGAEFASGLLAETVSALRG
ncbi:DUF5642 family protein [Mycolicibacterium vaccae]|uniref:DUF5642 domain-containing protein n=2 Tax=Mycolicibacterium vaccae TaxID=1810 RepID=K0UYY6_MYCVA|nr:DUF5642 family protein [Mycolicibacterium vaccae]ANI41714.1 hypothetical protein MYVA_4637 [Mycolicibacterium vaccae 95051]EJZ11961.1 hypothetical protein MVAC_03446 [Mycolicibacterium vaccae ATCC 25954]MCV7062193.1 DUF5642 family protein [Mycolicibacterium vaccae]